MGEEIPWCCKVLGTKSGSCTAAVQLPSAIRKLIYTTNAIESTNSSLRKVTKKGAFESSDAVYRALYLRILTLKEKWDKSRVQNWTTIKNELLQLPLTKERMEKLVFKS